MDDQATQAAATTKRPMWQWVIFYLLIALVLYALLYYFVLGKKSATPIAATPTPTPTVAVATPTQAATPSANPSMKPSGTPAAMKTNAITITGTEFAFTPSSFTVKKGQPVQVTFKNAGQYPHNFTITELSVKSATIQPGQTTTVTFTPTTAGTFTFICSVPGHADRGMKGTLTVQ